MYKRKQHIILKHNKEIVWYQTPLRLFTGQIYTAWQWQHFPWMWLHPVSSKVSAERYLMSKEKWQIRPFCYWSAGFRIWPICQSMLWNLQNRLLPFFLSNLPSSLNLNAYTTLRNRDYIKFGLYSTI